MPQPPSDKPRVRKPTNRTSSATLLAELKKSNDQLLEAVLSRIDSMNGQIGHLAESVESMHTRLTQLESHGVYTRFGDLEARLGVLERDYQERVGVKKAMEFWPKYLGWLASIVVFIASYIYNGGRTGG